VLLLLVAAGSYAGASYLADRFFAIELPQISMPQIGLPEVNLPHIDLEVPEWLQNGEAAETLIVNINEGLNLRDEPGLSTNVIAVIPNGTRVAKLEGPVNVDNVPWVRVRIERDNEPVEGWMSRNFLQSE
jgi:hypothetical protein